MSTPNPMFIACLEASREKKWLLQLQDDIVSEDLSPLPMKCINQSALTLYATGIIKGRTKRIDHCYHNSQDRHRQQDVYDSSTHTDENVADILMKALTTDKHTMFMKAICLC
jgi:hypothetical protein